MLMVQYRGNQSQYFANRLRKLTYCQPEGNSADLSWEIIDRSNNQTKLLTLEAIHIRKEKPGLNTRDEFRSRELTLKN